MSDSVNHVQRGHSRSVDPERAARELARSLSRGTPALHVVFADPGYDRDALARALGEALPDAPVVGCTTAGEIGPEGYLNASLSGFSLDASAFTVSIRRLSDLDSFQVSDGIERAQEITSDLRAGMGERFTKDRAFALLFIDGLSMREEIVTSAVHGGLGNLPLVGGSAGDALEFGSTWVLEGGRFHSNSAVVVGVATELPFRIFDTHHFKRGENSLVVTKADPDARIIHEFNGYPAAEEYARAVGIEVDAIGPEILGRNPVVIRIGGEDHVRSLKCANDDGSMSLFCAIEEGLVLRLAERGDMVKGLGKLAADLEKDVGQPQLVIACDCILRQLEARSMGIMPEVENILSDLNAVGFSTYGEQIHSIHVNQTLTGIAIGRREDAA